MSLVPVAPFFASIRMTPLGGSRMVRFLERAHGSDEIFDGATIFHAGRALDAAANVHGVGRYRFDRSTNILRV
jgi:hypothetical protein